MVWLTSMTSYSHTSKMSAGRSVPGGGPGVNRVLNKLKSSIKDGKYYEAHQMYRTLYFRYLAQRKYEELQELLYDGALDLLIHKQNSSGADLALLFVDVLVQSNSSVADGLIEKLSRLFELMSPDLPERSKFLSSALKWSSSNSVECKFGHPKLHRSIAITLWKVEKNYQQSWCHFLRSTDGDNCATMLIEYQNAQGYSGEVDLFIAQAVLQYLCLQNQITASVVFYRYTERHPKLCTGPPFLLPLLNFLRFLLLAVESGKLAVFTVLCDQYQSSIKRDPTYSQYLDKIGQLFFGLPPPQPKNPSLFGNFLQSIVRGLGEEEEDDDDISETSSSSRRLHTEELD
ncbi:hypothetical protein CHUAL_011712 [Chamberlinius hualienensis]